MIVEDEAAISLALEDAFQEAGFKVLGPFSSSASALIKLAHEAPSVAVLDTILTDGSCLELARELRLRGVPFVVYSGYEEDHERAPELRDVPWVRKPALHASVVSAARGALVSSPPLKVRIKIK